MWRNFVTEERNSKEEKVIITKMVNCQVRQLTIFLLVYT